MAWKSVNSFRLIPAVAERIALAVSKGDYNLVTDRLQLLHRSVLAYDSTENRNLFEAVVAAEDWRFSTHYGFDVRAMLRALWASCWRGHLQGASTIDQQLVRVIRSRYELTISRKVSEIILATALQQKFSKATILELYMEVAYFGWRGNGIRQICERLEYPLHAMTRAQAAEIAALIKAPMPKQPSDAYKARLKRRVLHIARRMEAQRRKGLSQ